MKNLFLFLLLSTVVSCSKDAEVYPQLEGFYSLIDIGCECEPFNIIPNQQQWRVDYEESVMDVRTFGNEVNHLFLEAGIYPINFDSISYPGNVIIEIDGGNYGFRDDGRFMNIDQTITSGIADLPVHTFEKN